MKSDVSIDLEKCVGCSKCVKDCPEYNIVMENNKAVIRRDECLKCGHCVAICPKGAVRIPQYDEEEIIPISEEDKLNSDTLLKVIKGGRSIRQFKDIPVEKEKLMQIIEAGRYTATASNKQDVSYIVITEKNKEIEKEAVKLLRLLKKPLGLFIPIVKSITVDDEFYFKNAPAVIVVVSKDQVNGSLAASNMELMAESLGLGTFYSGFFTRAVNISAKLRSLLKMEKGQKVATVLVIGYPNVTYERTVPRKKADIQFV
ncbi:nitroreductase family protein [Clostridium sp. 'White wine YQ']|uniref:nitroreductase family protein n=1 Tax=Clostridium sp. 'White wine YQ' TaxID=3027474 RepID=UPI002365607F|nr:nitroreductase family protein [Clostridium sp. 'White wine YQ']MDD7795073.1 nitroreductase family protein [Clostridium sp. 'White wine YQ']